MRGMVTMLCLLTLIFFPSFFKGEHIKHKKYVDVRAGKKITVEFDSPRPLQIDGETVLGVTSYTVKAYSPEKAPEAEALL